MDPEEYKICLQKNPELYWHPEYLISPDCPSRDFIFEENTDPTPEDDPYMTTQQKNYSDVNKPQGLITDSVRDSLNGLGSAPYARPDSLLRVGSRYKSAMTSSMHGSVISSRGYAESVYFDAYTGDDQVDEVIKWRNQIVTEATNVTEEGQRKKRRITNKEQSVLDKTTLVPQTIPESEEPLLVEDRL